MNIKFNAMKVIFLALSLNLLTATIAYANIPETVEIKNESSSSYDACLIGVNFDSKDFPEIAGMSKPLDIPNNGQPKVFQINGRGADYVQSVRCLQIPSMRERFICNNKASCAAMGSNSEHWKIIIK